MQYVTEEQSYFVKAVNWRLRIARSKKNVVMWMLALPALGTASLTL